MWGCSSRGAAQTYSDCGAGLTVKEKGRISAHIRPLAVQSGSLVEAKWQEPKHHTPFGHAAERLGLSPRLTHRISWPFGALARSN